MRSIVPRSWLPIERAWVEKREALLIAAEDAIFRAARDRAATAEERAWWNELIAAREAHLREQAK